MQVTCVWRYVVLKFSVLYFVFVFFQYLCRTAKTNENINLNHVNGWKNAQYNSAQLICSSYNRSLQQCECVNMCAPCNRAMTWFPALSYCYCTGAKWFACCDFVAGEYLSYNFTLLQNLWSILKWLIDFLLFDIFDAE